MADKASLRRLRLSHFKLNALLEITQAINDNLPTEILLTKFQNILKEDLNIGQHLVYSFNSKKWECIVASGIVKPSPNEINVEEDLLVHEDIETLSSTKNKLLKTFDVVIPVYHKDVPLAFVLIGDIDEERDGISPTIKHLHFIQTLTNIIIVAIENKRLYKENIRQEMLKKELELASKMQNMLIPDPKTFPNNEKLHVGAYYNPHFEVGGDYYDFIKLNDDEYGFCIADVSGKGISAALLMSNFQANLKALFTTNIPLADLIIKLNDTVMNSANGEKFITMFIGRYNTATRQLDFINAGHNPPILYDIEKSTFTYLKDGCIGLGMLNEIPTIAEGKLMIGSKSKLICYTDGLVEVENENRVEFGTERVESAMANNNNINDTINALIKDLDSYKGDLIYFDDVSIIGLYIN